MSVNEDVGEQRRKCIRECAVKFSTAAAHCRYEIAVAGHECRFRALARELERAEINRDRQRGGRWCDETKIERTKAAPYDHLLAVADREPRIGRQPQAIAVR